MNGEWASKSDSASVEQTLSKNSRKQWRHKHTAPELSTRGIILPPNSTPVDISLGHVLPLVGHTKFGEEGPNFPLPKGIVEPMPMWLTLPPWGKRDPPASVTGKLPCLLGKSKPRQRSWQISDPEFQKALQDARAVCPTDRTGEQHVIVTCMTKHEKQQTHAKATPPFMIQQGITKELADTMQAWILHKFACPPAMRQLPDGTLNLHLDEEDFTQGRHGSLQTSILAPIYSAKLVQHLDQC